MRPDARAYGDAMAPGERAPGPPPPRSLSSASRSGDDYVARRAAFQATLRGSPRVYSAASGIPNPVNLDTRVARRDSPRSPLEAPRGRRTVGRSTGGRDQRRGRDALLLSSEDPQPYAHIACCVEDSPGSRRALEEARRLRAFGRGRLTIVHVTPSLYGESLALPPVDDITTAASTWLTTEFAHVAGAELVLLSGLSAGVCDWAREACPDLLLAGAHRGRRDRLTLGSFAGCVAYHAPCNVLLVRPDAR